MVYRYDAADPIVHAVFVWLGYKVFANKICMASIDWFNDFICRMVSVLSNTSIDWALS